MTHAHAETLPPPPPTLLNGASLFLDFDGTLVEIAARPDAVRVELRLRQLIQRLAETLRGRIAIISGRPADQVATFFEGIGIALGGSHGAELRLPGGDRLTQPQPRFDAQTHAALRALVESHPGVLVEEKPYGFALHYRVAPEAEAACRALARALSARTGLVLQNGKMVIELRAGGADKGTALESFMARPSMAGTHPVFAGDDETDEAAFRAAHAMGGTGILVGAPRPTAAAWRLPGVDATLTWLERAAEAVR